MSERRYQALPLRNPAHLFAVFAAKGQKLVVLQMSYVEQLPPEVKQGLLEIVARCRGEDLPTVILEMERIGPAKALWRRASEGYLRLPVVNLCDGRFSMPELEVLQRVVMEYRDQRMGAGATAVEVPCSCNGENGCGLCRGKGTVVVLDEMTEEERIAAG
jgi:hypothetical protein